MPEATAEAWRNGWFHTGDQFTQDEDGNFYFLDRIKDVIRRRGENISSFEVEAEVMSHPLVKDAAAIAVKNPDLDGVRGRRGGQGRRRARGGRHARPRGADRVPRRADAAPTGCRGSSSSCRSCRARSRTSSRRRSCAIRHHRGHVGPREGRDQAQAGSPAPDARSRWSTARLGSSPGAASRAAATRSRSETDAPRAAAVVVRELLPSEGVLWTWTTQGFEPKPPYVPDGDFVPYGVGYVEFPRLPPCRGSADRGARPSACASGCAMRVVALERAGRITYAFEPV